MTPFENLCDFQLDYPIHYRNGQGDNSECNGPIEKINVKTQNEVHEMSS